jgi:hypothetical protein
MVAALEDRCGAVLADLRAVLTVDKQIAALAGVGFQPVWDRLQREFFAA